MSTYSICESDFLTECTHSGIASSTWGHIQQTSQYIAPGLTLSTLQCETHRDLRVIPNAHSGSVVCVVAVSLTGKSSFEAATGPSWRFLPNCHSWGLRTAHKGVRYYPAGQHITQLRLILSQELTQYYLGPSSQRFLKAHACQPIKNSSALTRATQQLLQRRSDLAPLTLHQACLDLLQLALPAEDTRNGGPLGIQHVLALIHAGHADHLTVTELAMHTGLGVRQFKQEFRKRTSLGVQQYVQQQRMQRGLKLLRQGWRVSQVAYQLGYEHPNNFSAAFARHFGYAPSEV